MKILIICSKKNYGLVPEYKIQLEKLGHKVYLPNCIDDPSSEQKAKDNGTHKEFKQAMYKQSAQTISEVDAVLVVNPNKNDIAGYVGGATFLEIYEAFNNSKKIYTTDKIVQPVFLDEADGFGYKVIKDITDIV